MKTLIAGLILGAAVVASAGQMPKYGVTVTVDKKVDFATFKTYSWTKGQPSALKQVDAEIMAAVDHELAGLGMTKAASGPGDVMVAYYSLTRTDVDLTGKEDAAKLPQYQVGTLMVAFLDPASRARIVRMRIDKPITEANSAKLKPEIDEAVSEIFAKYPTRTEKK
jgi:Domain of unknown function (DUF4136)